MQTILQPAAYYETMLRAIAEGDTDAIILCEQGGCIVFWNKGAEKLYGYTAEEILGEHLSMIMPSSYREFSQKAVQCLNSQERCHGQTCEVLLLRKNGTEIRAEISISSTSLGKDKYYFCIIRDIIERRIVPNAAWESEQRLRVLAESAVDGIILVDRLGTIVFWNKGARDIFGFEDHEAIGKPVDIILPKRLHLKNIEMFSKMKIKGDDFIGLTVEKCALRKDGSEFPAEVSYSTLKSIKGTFYFAIVRDISERNRAAKMLEKVNQCILHFGPSAENNIKKALKCACELVDGDSSLYVTKKGHCFAIQESWQISGELRDYCNLPLLWNSIIANNNSMFRIFNTNEMAETDSIDRIIRHIGMRTCIGAVVKLGNKIVGIIAVLFGKEMTLGVHETKMFSILAQAIRIEEERKRTMDELRDRQNRLRISEGRLKKFSGKILSIREEEKKALSRELHDELGTMIVSASLCLSIAEEESRKIDKIILAEMIGQTKLILKKSVARIRTIAVDLRPPELDIIGLPDALRKYCTYIAEQTGIMIDCRICLKDISVNDTQGIALYRIVQEAMHNIIKHASAQHVRLLLSGESGFIHLQIVDDGKGFELNTKEKHGSIQHRCLGLHGMRERTECLNGTFAMNSRIGYGSELSIKIPLLKVRKKNEHKSDSRR